MRRLDSARGTKLRPGAGAGADADSGAGERSCGLSCAQVFVTVVVEVAAAKNTIESIYLSLARS